MGGLNGKSKGRKGLIVSGQTGCSGLVPVCPGVHGGAKIGIRLWRSRQAVWIP